MKKNKLLLTGLFFVSLAFFFGCQSTRSPDPSKVKQMIQNQEKRIGVIESLGGAKVSSQATHLLRMENGSTLFLKSSVLALADQKYGDIQVEVAGNILRTTDGNEVMEVMNIDMVDRKTSTINEAPQWVDYTSENLQLSLKYRDDYKLQEEDDKVTLIKTQKTAEESLKTVNDTLANGNTDASAQKEATITIKVISKDAGFNLIEAMGVPSDSTADLLAKGYNKSKITQKALDAYKQSGADGSQISYFVKSGYSYQINYTVGQKDTAITDQNMFYDIMASIDFGGVTKSESVAIKDQPEKITGGDEEIESSRGNTDIETAINGFQTFTSEAMKFSVQYPKSYYFDSGNSSGAGIIKSYVFSDKPLEESNGTKFNLEIVKGDLPSSGKQTELGGKKAFVNSAGGKTDVYISGNSGQYFHFNGIDSDKALMQQMASTLQF